MKLLELDLLQLQGSMNKILMGCPSCPLPSAAHSKAQRLPGAKVVRGQSAGLMSAHGLWISLAC